MDRLNLIPAAFQLAQVRRRRLRGWSVLVGATVAASSLPALAQWMQERNLNELRELRQAAEINLSATRSELKSLTVESSDLFLRLERAKALRSKRNWSGMFRLLATALPADCWLSLLATDPDLPPLVPATPKSATPAPVPAGKAGSTTQPVSVTIDAPRRLRIVGHSSEASGPLAFVLKLKEAGVFRDVILQRTQRESADPQSPFRFEMVCEW